MKFYACAEKASRHPTGGAAGRRVATYMSSSRKRKMRALSLEGGCKDAIWRSEHESTVPDYNSGSCVRANGDVVESIGKTE